MRTRQEIESDLNRTFRPADERLAGKTIASVHHTAFDEIVLKYEDGTFSFLRPAIHDWSSASIDHETSPIVHMDMASMTESGLITAEESGGILEELRRERINAHTGGQ